MQQKKYTQEEIDAIIETLPEDVKDAIFSFNSANLINGVGKKYGLHIDQIGILAEETGDILLGISRPTEFVDNLQKKIGIERVRASEIAAEINEKIFAPIRESLRNVGKVEDSGKEILEIDESKNYIPKKEDLLEAIQRPDMYARPQSPEIRSPINKDILPPEVEPQIPSGIPQKPQPANLMEKKLSGTISIPKSGSGKASDPYREAF